MSFPESVRTNVLLKCKRYCCLCGKYAGTNLELHHIRQSADGGQDTEENCIPLCFDCHAEVRSYNPHHPKGLKYNEKELKLRRDAIYAAVQNQQIVSKYSEKDVETAKRICIGYYQVWEEMIRVDPCGEPVHLVLLASAEDMLNDLQSYRYRFIHTELDREKCNLIMAIDEWLAIIGNPDNFRLVHDTYLLCDNSTVGNYRERMIQIRWIMRDIYVLFRSVAEERIWPI